MGFRISVILNDLKQRNGRVVCIISPILVAFRAHCVQVVEDRPTHSASEM